MTKTLTLSSPEDAQAKSQEGKTKEKEKIINLFLRKIEENLTKGIYHLRWRVDEDNDPRIFDGSYNGAFVLTKFRHNYEEIIDEVVKAYQEKGWEIESIIKKPNFLNRLLGDAEEKIIFFKK